MKKINRELFDRLASDLGYYLFFTDRSFTSEEEFREMHRQTADIYEVSFYSALETAVFFDKNFKKLEKKKFEIISNVSEIKRNRHKTTKEALTTVLFDLGFEL